MVGASQGFCAHLDWPSRRIVGVVDLTVELHFADQRAVDRRQIQLEWTAATQGVASADPTAKPKRSMLSRYRRVRAHQILSPMLQVLQQYNRAECSRRAARAGSRFDICF